MEYISTRDAAVRVRSAQAIVQGISAEGGLFVPASIPRLAEGELARLSGLSYIDRAKAVLAHYLDDFTPQELDFCIQSAYGDRKFADPAVAPLAQLCEGVYMLELWKGPTCAFKDMALQLLPQLLTVSARKTAQGQEIVILVATSGDTGKAALEGFTDVDGTKIVVFYPSEGVSPMQKLQMVTQDGANVGVCAVKGNFDDTQNGVKAIFTDAAVARRLRQKGQMLSSANSINWGRLVPQIVYYISAYCDLLAGGKLQEGDAVNVVVPTGNFGNILAAYYAKQMGLPIRKFICASNANNVLTDFIQSGVYDSKRAFYTTSSPSMDILVSSNLERLLFLLCGCDAAQVRGWMEQLRGDGIYSIPANMLRQLQSCFAAGYCDDAQTKQTIAAVWERSRYLCDPHTAVGLRVYEDYRKKTGDDTPTVIASTANPFKFGADVLEALTPGQAADADEFATVQKLQELTGEICPERLAGLRGKQPRFEAVCAKETMENAMDTLLAAMQK